MPADQLVAHMARHEAEESEPRLAPVTIIKPSSGWSPFDLHAVSQYRELLYFLTWRDIKVRYKQTALGISWVLLQPLVTMLLFTAIFGHIAHLPSSGVPYPIFTLCALLPWTYFAYILQQSAYSLLNNSAMVSKVYFPRILLPASTVLSGLLDFVLTFLLLVVMLVFFHMTLSWRVLFIPIFLCLTLTTSLGAGLWLSALSVKFRDVKYALPFVTQVWLYISPVAYSSGVVPGKLAFVYGLNPMTGVINGFRWSLLGVGPAPGLSVITSAAISCLILMFGAIYFGRHEETFADMI